MFLALRSTEYYWALLSWYVFPFEWSAQELSSRPIIFLTSYSISAIPIRSPFMPIDSIWIVKELFPHSDKGLSPRIVIAPPNIFFWVAHFPSSVTIMVWFGVWASNKKSMTLISSFDDKNDILPVGLFGSNMDANIAYGGLFSFLLFILSYCFCKKNSSSSFLWYFDFHYSIYCLICARSSYRLIYNFSLF